MSPRSTHAYTIYYHTSVFIPYRMSFAFSLHFKRLYLLSYFLTIQRIRSRLSDLLFFNHLFYRINLFVHGKKNQKLRSLGNVKLYIIITNKNFLSLGLFDVKITISTTQKIVHHLKNKYGKIS